MASNFKNKVTMHTPSLIKEVGNTEGDILTMYVGACRQEQEAQTKKMEERRRCIERRCRGEGEREREGGGMRDEREGRGREGC